MTASERYSLLVGKQRLKRQERKLLRRKIQRQPFFKHVHYPFYLMLLWANGDRTFSQLSKRSYSDIWARIVNGDSIIFYKYETLLFQGSMSFKVTFMSECLRLREIYLRKYICTPAHFLAHFVYYLPTLVVDVWEFSRRPNVCFATVLPSRLGHCWKET